MLRRLVEKNIMKVRRINITSTQDCDMYGRRSKIGIAGSIELEGDFSPPQDKIITSGCLVIEGLEVVDIRGSRYTFVINGPITFEE